MSTTLSPSIRIIAVVGILAAAGLGGAFLLLGRTAPGPEPAGATAQVRTPASETPASPATTVAPKPRVAGVETTRSGFPLLVDRALRRHRVAVVVVVMPGSAVDAFVRREARAGAASSRAGFVAVSAGNEGVLRPLVAKTGVLPSPAVFVVKRSGTVGTILSVVDRELVAQAVAQARR
ncbi:MAG TPA: hypothetical protein VMN35_02600 [Gaiellaceae bacterium]|nr:hypothetical protein [Gaiellaceae bacterium]